MTDTTCTTNKPSIAQTNTVKQGRGLLWGLIIFALLGLGFICSLFYASTRNGSLPLQNKVAIPQEQTFTVGDLGGMKVKIPRHFARLVEYEGDPGWGEKREGARPERTYESKLTSFTARIRYPDMQGLTSDELRLDYKQATIHNTMWFSLGVSTGNHFGDGLFLERMKQAAKKSDIWSKTGLIWTKKPKKEHGLEVYSPANADVSTRVPFKGDNADDDHFFSYNSEGKVTNYMRCSNKTHAAAPCEQFFFLPTPLKAKIIVKYRRGLLPHWQDLQTKTTAHLLSFKLNDATP
jgi:hypothetical protein